MAEVKWVKLTTDMFDNRKIRHLRRLPEGNNIVLIWVMLLTMAGRCNSGGMILLTENIPYTPKMLADELGFEENTVLPALQALEQLDMIVTDNGVFTIAGWEEYQNIEGMEKIREQNRLRKQRQRERQRLLEGESQNVTGQVTGRHATEEEVEVEKEEESHSFIRAREDEEDFDEDFEECTEEQKEATRQYLIEQRKLRFMDGSLGQGVVLMSNEQFGDLCEKLSLDEIDKYFGIVAEMERNGKHYRKKTHYQAILDMARKDRRVNK